LDFDEWGVYNMSLMKGILTTAALATMKRAERTTVNFMIDISNGLKGNVGIRKLELYSYMVAVSSPHAQSNLQYVR
jgi:hypothetical protein